MTILRKAGLAAVLAGSLFVPAAEAQQRARPRAPMPPVSMAQASHPRANGIPGHLRRGTRVGPRSFSVNAYFYGGFNGYVRYGMFYPFGCFPPADPWTAHNLAAWNMYRGPTVSQMRRMGMGYPIGEPVPGPMDDGLARENEDLRRENEALRLEAAERRGYERGVQDRPDVTTNMTGNTTVIRGDAGRSVEREEPAPKEVPSHTFTYRKCIARNQVPAEVKGFLDDYYTAIGETDVRAYIEGFGNGQYIQTRRVGVGDMYRVDLGSFMSRPYSSMEELREFLYGTVTRWHGKNPDSVMKSGDVKEDARGCPVELLK